MPSQCQGVTKRSGGRERTLDPPSDKPTDIATYQIYGNVLINNYRTINNNRPIYNNIPKDSNTPRNNKPIDGNNAKYQYE